MVGRSQYWDGKRPSNGKAWTYTTSGKVLDEKEIKDAVFHMYRRYVKTWNDIELDMERCLSEHASDICGADIVGGAKRFILHWHEENQNHWILEVLFTKGFQEYYPGFSCARNPLRSIDDIRSVHLHWSGDGDQTFKNWLVLESTSNQENGEWSEYKA